MIRVLWEIVVPLLIAFAIGLLIGWMLWRWRRAGVSRAAWEEVDAERSTLVARADEAEARSARIDAELVSHRQRLDEAERARQGLVTLTEDQASELSARDASLAEAVTELGEARHRVADLEATLARLSGVEAELVDARRRVDELEAERADDPGRVADLEATVARLSAVEADRVEAERRLAEIGSELAAAQERNRGLTEVVARLGGVDAELADARHRIAELEAEQMSVPSHGGTDDGATTVIDLRDAPDCGHEPIIEDLRTRLAAAEAMGDRSWQQGTTTLGTPGADHVDDLKAVSGIGPKMEALLNGFGITTWEQLAALTEDEVARVDAALEEFPGRIRRDRWVEQARAFVANGHRPVALEDSVSAP